MQFEFLKHFREKGRTFRPAREKIAFHLLGSLYGLQSDSPISITILSLPLVLYTYRTLCKADVPKLPLNVSHAFFLTASLILSADQFVE
jgi:hypothetical protein